MACNTSYDTGADLSDNVYRYLFEPESIAIVGASNDRMKPGGRVAGNIKDNHFTGQLWAVNPKTPHVLDLPTFKCISDLPKGPDLAIIAIPSPFVVQALGELAEKGAKAVIVLTSGFGEKDDAGKQAEQQMLEIARNARMALIGPNCSGFITRTYKGKFAGIIPGLAGGAVDFISGSGATVDYVMEDATTRGLSFGNVVNLGNSIQMGVEDLLQLYDDNYAADNARILMLYLESVKKPAKLLRHARSLAQKGCVLVGIKSGTTAAGERAAASHTGAIATSDTAVEALFKKAGIIRVGNRAALVDAACVLAAAKGGIKGMRACVITDAGGPGVMLSDELSRQGFALPVLKESTQTNLMEILPAEASTTNPIDALPSRTAAQIHAIIDCLGKTEQDTLDVIIVLLGDSGMSDNAPIYDVLAAAIDNSPVPVVPMFSSTVTSRSKIDDFRSQGKVFFTDEVRLGQALGLVAGRHLPGKPASKPEVFDKKTIRKALDGYAGALPPNAVAAVLKAAGFLLPPQVEVFHRNDLAGCCADFTYPVVMKVIGPLHKSDSGGVKLNLANPDAVMAAWDVLMNIPEARGVMVQPMIGGQEVILGASREGDFGHLIMFGLGGIYTEVFRDVSFGLSPLSGTEIKDMIHGIRSFPILKGIRGNAGMSMDVLSDYIRRIDRLVTDFPEINEIDMNPVKGNGTNLYVVDARIIVTS